MAAVFALSLVPAGAFASEPSPDDTIANHNTAGRTGVLGDTSTGKGTITIANAKKGETYKVYRLFELASFDDENVNTGEHGTNDEGEAYSYVIDLAQSDGDYTNKWATFLTTYGTSGASSAAPYAILSDDPNAGTNTTAYFVIDAEPVTIKGADGTTNVSTYHYVRVNPYYSGDFSNENDDEGPYTARTGTDDDGNPAGIDYVLDSNSAIQNFAQEALKYAEANNVPLATKADGTASTAYTASADGSATLMSDAPLGYYLVGTTMGTLAALDTNNPDVTVYEKNDEPTIEKAILKKGEGFDDAAWADLVAKSAASRQKAIDDATAAKDEAQAALDAANADLTANPTDQDLIDAAEAAQAALDTASAALVQAQNAPDPVWVKNTDADLEDYVVFRTVITAQQGAKNYKLHDAMENGLELVTTAPAADTYVTDRYGAANTPAAPKVYLVHGDEVHLINATGGGRPVPSPTTCSRLVAT